MKKIIIAVFYTFLITLCINAQTKKDSLSPKADSISKNPNTTIPEYQNYPFNPANTSPNASPGTTAPSIDPPGTTLTPGAPGDTKAPGTQIAPDTSKVPGSTTSPISPGLQEPVLPDNRNMPAPSPSNPTAPDNPGLPNQTPLPD